MALPQKRKSVPQVLSSVAKVLRTELKRQSFATGELHSGQSISAKTPADSDESVGCEAAVAATCSYVPELRHSGEELADSSSASESESPSSASSPRSLTATLVKPAPPQTLPPLERLLPQEWRSDRGLLQAWQKGRDIAVADGVSWLRGDTSSNIAAVASRSGVEPHIVNLAICKCSCPNPKTFCSHLFAAAVAGKSESASGRAALLCLLRERSRARHESATAAERALQEFAELVPSQKILVWTLETLVCLLLPHAGGFAELRTSTAHRTRLEASPTSWKDAFIQTCEQRHEDSMSNLLSLASSLAEQCEAKGLPAYAVSEEIAPQLGPAFPLVLAVVPAKAVIGLLRDASKLEVVRAEAVTFQQNEKGVLHV